VFAPSFGPTRAFPWNTGCKQDSDLPYLTVIVLLSLVACNCSTDYLRVLRYVEGIQMSVPQISLLL